VEAVLNEKGAERDLPTMALPILRDRLNDPKLSKSTTVKLLGDSLKQDARLRIALIIQRRQAWYKKNVLDVFERHAANQSWAALARAAMLASISAWSDDPRDDGDAGMIIWREAWVADDMGCREPLLQFVRASNMDAFDWVHRARVAQAATVAADAVNADAAEIVPFIRMEADILAARALATVNPVTAERKAQIDDWVAKGKSLFPQILAEPDLPRQALFDLFNLLAQASVSIYGDRRTLPNSLFDQLQNSSIEKSVVLTIQGSFNIDYAWDARGNGYANTVTGGGWALMQQRLTKADAALENAWAMDHADSAAAAEMIRVEQGQGQGRDRMELWFKRAMDADPDNYYACAQKLYYLEPKWYGNAQEMLKFGHECRDGGNWDAGIPYILIDAHVSLSHYDSGGQWQQAMQPAYFQNNPQAWDDVQSTYEQDRKHRPRSVYKELMFAKIASYCGHWDKVIQILDDVGDAYDTRAWSVD
jgi:hypothetical protein